jgi:hypothetical protein
MENSTLDVNGLKSIESIQQLIAKYRNDQEKLHIKYSMDSAHHSMREGNLEKIFEHCCILSVVRQSTSYELGSWPQCLVGSYANKSAILGSFESYGSLWRFVKLDTDTQIAHSHTPAIKVAIECTVYNIYYIK